jgi:hypothetical protein
VEHGRLQDATKKLQRARKQTIVPLKSNETSRAGSIVPSPSATLVPSPRQLPSATELPTGEDVASKLTKALDAVISGAPDSSVAASGPGSSVAAGKQDTPTLPAEVPQQLRAASGMVDADRLAAAAAEATTAVNAANAAAAAAAVAAAAELARTLSTLTHVAASLGGLPEAFIDPKVKCNVAQLMRALVNAPALEGYCSSLGPTHAEAGKELELFVKELQQLYAAGGGSESFGETDALGGWGQGLESAMEASLVTAEDVGLTNRTINTLGMIRAIMMYKVAHRRFHLMLSRKPSQLLVTATYSRDRDMRWLYRAKCWQRVWALIRLDGLRKQVMTRKGMTKLPWIKAQHAQVLVCCTGCRLLSGRSTCKQRTAGWC